TRLRARERPRRQLQETERVDARPVDFRAPVQVRPGRTAGRSHGADASALRDDVADLHVDAREVEVTREETGAVVEDYGAPGEVEVLGERDTGGSGRRDLLSLARREIQPRVRGPRFPVEDAAGAEALLANGRVDRQAERSAPASLGVAALPDPL